MLYDFFYKNTQNMQIYRDQQQIGGCQVLEGVGGVGRMRNNFNGYRMSY